MNTVTCDIWELLETHKIVVPVNLSGPMSRGLAFQAKWRYPRLEAWWKGKCRREEVEPGEIVVGRDLILFPVKHHWADRADLELIERSLEALSWLDFPVAVPRIGCGFGERDWEGEVNPLVKKHLDKPNFLLVSMPPETKERYPEAFRPGIRSDRS